ncbi:MAG: DUF4126 family protein [Armatimonadetes bacterium]|nr:DUF4126 family protein [Armatimonadota bacterium]
MLGFGNPILSIFEDFVTAGATVLAIVAPVIALLLIAAILLWLFRPQKKSAGTP